MPAKSISVVIPLYNKSGMITRALRSLAAQTSPANEIIVVDDGSTDNSATEVIKFGTKSPALNVQLIQQPNTGVSAARNTGIKAARSQHVALLDADDTYAPEFLAEIRQLMWQWPNAVAYCTAYQFCQQGEKPRKARWHGMFGQPQHGLLPSFFRMTAHGDLPLSSSSVCIKRTELLKVGGFPLGQQMGEDQWLWSLLALSGDIAGSRRALSNYYLDAQNSLMAGTAPTAELPYSRMLQDLLDNGRYQGELAQDIAAMIRTHLFDLIRRNFTRGHYQHCTALLADSRLADWRLRSVYWRSRVWLRRSAANQPLTHKPNQSS